MILLWEMFFKSDTDAMELIDETGSADTYKSHDFRLNGTNLITSYSMYGNTWKTVITWTFTLIWAVVWSPKLIDMALIRKHAFLLTSNKPKIESSTIKHSDEWLLDDYVSIVVMCTRKTKMLVAVVFHHSASSLQFSFLLLCLFFQRQRCGPFNPVVFLIKYLRISIGL